MTCKIAMWSGPRNISTAMMRAWENRADCVVIDEPLYGYYLSETGMDHPGADDIIKDQGSCWQPVVERCLKDPKGGESMFFQKHMTMHMLPEVSRDWLAKLNNCFLIRCPEEVVASYAAVRDDLTLEDVGFVQMLELYEKVKVMAGSEPVVIDSKAFLQNPEDQLRKLCGHIGVEFSGRMLSWPAGKRDSDGVWGPYWYDSVWKSTGFQAYYPRKPTLNAAQQSIADAAQPYYQAMLAKSL